MSGTIQGVAALRIRPVAAALCAGALALSGACGAGQSEDSQSSARESVEAAPKADAESREKKRPEAKALRLLENGNPTVFVKVGATVDLYDEPDGKVVESVGHMTDFGSRTVYAVTEEKNNWAAVLTPVTENGEPLWLELDPERLRAGRTVWDLEVDLSEFETRLYEGGKLVKTFPVSVGMPTAPTPTGRFAITDTFRGGLNEAYGCCALATTARQTNLPSGWLGGDRIAFHGTSGEIGAEVSHGCVRAADGDVSALVDRVPPGTPVEIHE
ncbi:MAG: L,D-transpeptidase [Actinomycetota bacterium]|nr:L,D-transpeptidase [Actinomycetota bacterium]